MYNREVKYADTYPMKKLRIVGVFVGCEVPEREEMAEKNKYYIISKIKQGRCP
jgi:hypothetical protein